MKWEMTTEEFLKDRLAVLEDEKKTRKVTEEEYQKLKKVVLKIAGKRKAGVPELA